MSDTALLEMENVQVKYGPYEVFSDFSLTLPADKSSVVIGPNGSGKSTLLKLIFRHHYPEENVNSRFRVLGQKSRERDQLRMRMGLVSRDLQSKIDKESTVLQVVIAQFYSSINTYVHQTYTEEQVEIARKHIDFMEIGHLSSCRFMAISAGEQQRCLLARALIHDPEFLILDEPTSHLDIKATHQFLEMMSKLIENGKKLVLVTHHLHEIVPEINWFVCLKNGQVLDQGERKKILTDKKMSNLFGLPVQLDSVDGRLTPKVITR